MAGVTATISVQAFRRDWARGLTIADLCQRYTVTKDQVVRLRTVWRCELRHDRRKRAKPEPEPEPTPEEDAASARSCELAPQVAIRAAAERTNWCDVTYLLRSGVQPSPYTVPTGVHIDAEPE